MPRGGLNLKATSILALLILVGVIVVYRISAQTGQNISRPVPKNTLVSEMEMDQVALTAQSECPYSVNPTNVYSRYSTQWKLNVNVCNKCINFPKATLKTQFGDTPIFIYQSASDVWVSGVIKTTGHFEAAKTNGIAALLQTDSNLNLIDIGANIGVHTLAIAKMGRKVLAVEALDKNIQHLCASVTAGDMQHDVTIVYNAISDGHMRVKLGVDKNNMGGTYVDVDSKHIKDLKEGRAQGTYGEVDTITMDDLVELPVFKNFSKVIVKMDIEGFEHKAISKSEKFFKAVDVQAFIMEWEFHRKMSSGGDILKRMKDLKFEPYRVENPSARLSVESSDSWPYDVLWRPAK
ncbi:uncharacterized protein LOC132562394 [Ylistrum balloti]|uniref:uncharacterized protein LOC132562394 n=1 Tax=Ylistrum balloti TaxID=509963 RepID=UPI0029059CEE|nr:uncharacterized protein LOC132562394 [Ylistrum balloti]